MRISDWSSDVCSSDLVTIADGRMVDENPHLDRLERSLGEISIPMPMSRRALKLVMRELVRRNAVRNGLIYMQVTSGVAPRDHRIPATPLAPSLVMTTKRIRSEEHTSELQSLMRNSYAVFSLKKKRDITQTQGSNRGNNKN